MVNEAAVRARYSDAARHTQSALCCPVHYDPHRAATPEATAGCAPGAGATDGRCC
jgi:hypothetical protein